MSTAGGARSFYERRVDPQGWGRPAPQRAEREALAHFVAAHGLENGRLLEVGCGAGEFQDLLPGWVGVDLALGAARYLRAPFAVASAEALPFLDRSFDALWSVAVFEHVPRPEHAFEEVARVLKPGGLAWLAPAWHCRPWAAEGLHVRPWSDLDLRQRLIKSTIPLRESLAWRAAGALPLRVLHELGHALRPRRPLRLRYGRLTPNYATFWCSDSDACSVLDPHETLLWFLSRGFEAVSHPGLRRRFLARHGPIVVRKP